MGNDIALTGLPLKRQTALSFGIKLDYYTALIWAKYEFAQPQFDEFLAGPGVVDMRLFFP